ncbi:MAG: tetratricopeptide repeat protein, partial [Gemmata sp.]
MPRDRAADDAHDLFARGHKALSTGDYQEAVECYSRAIRLRPG